MPPLSMRPSQHYSLVIDPQRWMRATPPMTSTRLKSQTSGVTWRHGGEQRALRERASGSRGRVVVELAEIGRRPVVVLSRDAAIPRLRRVLVAPCTTTIRGLASEVVLE